MTRQEATQSAAMMLAQARNDAGLSQRYVAQSIGVGERTVKNWEAGSSAPNIVQMVSWFRACGINPIRYVLDWLDPAHFDGLTATDSIEDVKSAIMAYIEDIATEKEVRQLAFCMFGNHGSSWRSQLDMLTAHDHTTLRSRVTVARAVLENYEMEESQGILVNADSIPPDLSRLRDAVENGKDAVQEGKRGYVGI